MNNRNDEVRNDEVRDDEVRDAEVRDAEVRDAENATHDPARFATCAQVVFS